MKIIAMDLELNQPSQKIIQIGASCFNLSNGKEIDKFDELVNPGESIDRYIEKLCGVDDRMFDGLDGIELVSKRFWDWVGKQTCGNKVYAWGNDVKWLVDQGFKPPKYKEYNFKQAAELFRTAKNRKSKGGLKNTLETFGIQFVGQQHNAYYDAYNTARLIYEFYNNLKDYYFIKKLMLK